MSQKNTYKIGKIHQLFDLNNDATNFVCNFKIMADNPQKHFEYIVLTQKQLDNLDDLPPFNKAPGIGEGSIVADKGIHDQYFLALRSNEQHSVSVEKNLQKLPDNYHMNQNNDTSNDPYQQQMDQQQMDQQQMDQQQMLSRTDTQQNKGVHNDQHIDNAYRPGGSLYDRRKSDRTFLQKMANNKIVWVLLTIGVLVSVYLLFLSNSQNSLHKSSKIKKKSSSTSSMPSTNLDKSASLASNVKPLDIAPAVSSSKPSNNIPNMNIAELNKLDV